MTVRQALREAYAVLSSGRVDTPVLDATVLLAEAMGVSKERLLADLPETVAAGCYAAFRSFLDMRLEGIPVSYIRRRKEFYGLEFTVDERVLVPRPETETLVESVIELARGRRAPVRLHDACTGSGCVAIACALHAPGLFVSVSDLSAGALEVCAANAGRLLGSEIEAYQSDLLDGVEGSFDIISANPPYLTEREVAGMLEKGWPEPPLALSGGADGMESSRRLIRQARGHLVPGGSLLMEMAPWQAGALQEELERAGYAATRVIRDLAGDDRVIAADEPGGSTS